MTQKEKYQEEYEKYKHIEIVCGKYMLASNNMIDYLITDIDSQKEMATLLTLSSKNVKQKTLHWCKKNLVKIPDDSQNFFIKRLEDKDQYLCEECNYIAHFVQKVCTKCGTPLNSEQ